MLSAQEVEDHETRGFVIVNDRPVRVLPGSLERLFSGTKDKPAPDLPVFAAINTTEGATPYLVSDDHKRWRVWCPCVRHGGPVCADWNPRGLPMGVDLDSEGNVGAA